jgi:hypothetical protein
VPKGAGLGRTPTRAPRPRVPWPRAYVYVGHLVVLQLLSILRIG